MLDKRALVRQAATKVKMALRFETLLSSRAVAHLRHALAELTEAEKLIEPPPPDAYDGEGQTAPARGLRPWSTTDATGRPPSVQRQDQDRKRH